MKKTNFFSKLVFVLILLPTSLVVQAQVTFPENGVADPRHGHYAFTNATIVKDATTTLTTFILIMVHLNVRPVPVPGVDSTLTRHRK